MEGNVGNVTNMTLCEAPPYGYILPMMRLTSREREVIEAFATIGREDICAKQIASRLGMCYRVMQKHRYKAMKRNGFTSWNGFLSEYAQEMVLEKDS